MWFFLFWCALLSVVAVSYFRKKYSVFKKRGVKNVTPVPLLGNLTRVVLGMEHTSRNVERVYKKFSNERFFGGFEFMNPVLFIRDLALVKQITVKDSEHFIDHRNVVDEKIEPLWGRSLLSLKGHQWKDMRSTLSPAFTSSKIRNMVPFMIDVGDHMVQSIKKNIKETGADSVVLDTKDMTSRCANDIIASCAFGLKVDSHAEPNNEFYINALKATTFKLRQLLMFFAYNSFPWLMKILKVGLFSKSTRNYFSQLFTKAMKEREENNIIRPDMIYLLMEAKKGKLTHDNSVKDTTVGFATVEESDVGKRKVITEWSDNDLIAQAMAFLLGGFETVSTVMTFTLHELAIHPEVQDKLVKEIKEYDAKNNGQLDFNTLQNMEYMDMVVSETLRLWPPGFIIDRLCVKDCNIGKPNKDAKEDYIIRKGEGVLIPVWAIQRNPEYFPNPNKFYPESFSEENRAKMNQYAFIPFGSGPRNCIGSRFALCVLKANLYQLLLNFEICPTEKTTIPIELIKTTFNPSIKGGSWLQYKQRQ